VPIRPVEEVALSSLTRANLDSRNSRLVYFRYGNGSETIGAAVDCRCPVATQLMSVTASPGRTWRIFIAERQLPVLATALAAYFPHGGARVARLSGLARASPAASFAHQRRQGDFRCQPGRKSCSTGLLGRAMASLPVRDFSLDRSEVTSIWK
jgi:hypothetical protein